LLLRVTHHSPWCTLCRVTRRAGQSSDIYFSLKLLRLRLRLRLQLCLCVKRVPSKEPKIFQLNILDDFSIILKYFRFIEPKILKV